MEHTNLSTTTEEESHQLNPSVDSCATFAEDETSYVEDPSETSGGFDKVPARVVTGGGVVGVSASLSYRISLTRMH